MISVIIVIIIFNFIIAFINIILRIVYYAYHSYDDLFRLINY